MGIIDKIKRALKAASNEINKPESFTKGDEFENYVREVVFPKNEYELIHKTSSFQENQEDFRKTTLNPDFLFRCKKTGKEFYVEAKFRSNLYKNKIEWSKKHQFDRYKEINKTKDVFLCLGFDGIPKAPKQIYVIPISEIKYTGLFPSSIKSYKFDINKSISSCL